MPIDTDIEPNTISERVARMRERDAFMRGLLYYGNPTRRHKTEAVDILNEEYPMPKRIRILKLKSGTQYKYEYDTLYVKSAGATLWCVSSSDIEEMVEIANLKTSPYYD